MGNVVLRRQFARLVKTEFVEINQQSSRNDVINDLPKNCVLFPQKGNHYQYEMSLCFKSKSSDCKDRNRKGWEFKEKKKKKKKKPDSCVSNYACVSKTFSCL